MMQPFHFSSALIDNFSTQVVIVKELSPLAKVWETQYGSGNLSQYIGAQVVTIDGEDALQHLMDFSLAEGFISKDPGKL